MDKIDPMALAWKEYNPMLGDCGRGRVDLKPEDVDLTGWTRYSIPGKSGPDAINIPLYGEDGCGSMWSGWTKTVGGKQVIIAFERPMTPEELAVPRPTYSPLGGVHA